MHLFINCCLCNVNIVYFELFPVHTCRFLSKYISQTDRFRNIDNKILFVKTFILCTKITIWKSVSNEIKLK